MLCSSSSGPQLRVKAVRELGAFGFWLKEMLAFRMFLLKNTMTTLEYLLHPCFSFPSPSPLFRVVNLQANEKGYDHNKTTRSRKSQSLWKILGSVSLDAGKVVWCSALEMMRWDQRPRWSWRFRCAGLRVPRWDQLRAGLCGTGAAAWHGAVLCIARHSSAKRYVSC